MHAEAKIGRIYRIVEDAVEATPQGSAQTLAELSQVMAEALDAIRQVLHS